MKNTKGFVSPSDPRTSCKTLLKRFTTGSILFSAMTLILFIRRILIAITVQTSKIKWSHTLDVVAAWSAYAPRHISRDTIPVTGVFVARRYAGTGLRSVVSLAINFVLQLMRVDSERMLTYVTRCFRPLIFFLQNFAKKKFSEVKNFLDFILGFSL